MFSAWGWAGEGVRDKISNGTACAVWRMQGHTCRSISPSWALFWACFLPLNMVFGLGSSGLGPTSLETCRACSNSAAVEQMLQLERRMQQGLRRAAWYHSQSQTHGERTS